MRTKRLKVKRAYRKGETMTVLGEIWTVVDIRDVNGERGQYWLTLKLDEV